MISIYDFAFQPPHPDDWLPVLSKELEEHDIHTLTDWLWTMCRGRWGVVTHYTPALRQCVYFEQTQDAVGFKMAWGGA